MIDKSLIQGTNEWLDLRRTKVTASDIPVIMGISPWKKPKELFLEKMGKETESNTAMMYGSSMESQARDEYIQEFGIEIYPKVCIHENGWMMASIDGINEHETFIVEIKCPYNKYRHTDSIPDHYYAQIQAQLYVTSLKMAFYYVYIPSIGGHAQSVEFDEDYCTRFLSRAKVFYDCIVAKDFTEFEKLDFDVISTNEEMEELIAEYKTACIELDIATDKKEYYKKKILESCNGQPTKYKDVTIDQSFRKGAIDYSSIEALEGVDLEKYRKSPIEIWKITY